MKLLRIDWKRYLVISIEQNGIKETVVTEIGGLECIWFQGC